MRVVIKLSGSLFDSNISEIVKLANLIKKLVLDGVKLVLVAGGGSEARKFIERGRSLGLDESTLDEMGICIARLNAMLMIGSLGEIAYPNVPTTLEELSSAFETGKVVVLGGLHPGQSTNAVAALVAERIKADLFINATDVEGVFDKDPNLYPDAKLLSEIKLKELEEILRNKSARAGTYELLDPVALRILERSKLNCLIVKCTPEIIEKAIKGENVGTKIVI